MDPQIATQLHTLAARLRAEGRPNLAARLEDVATTLRDAPATAAEDLLTTGQAAHLLGLRSLNTVKKWARAGLLEGYRRGGRVLVTRRSVKRVAQRADVARERAAERDLDEVLAAFDGGEAAAVAGPAHHATATGGPA